jgi:hypothetical protein
MRLLVACRDERRGRHGFSDVLWLTRSGLALTTGPSPLFRLCRMSACLGILFPFTTLDLSYAGSSWPTTLSTQYTPYAAGYLDVKSLQLGYISFVFSQVWIGTLDVYFHYLLPFHLFLSMKTCAYYSPSLLILSLFSSCNFLNYKNSIE